MEKTNRKLGDKRVEKSTCVVEATVAEVFTLSSTIGTGGCKTTSVAVEALQCTGRKEENYNSL